MVLEWEWGDFNRVPSFTYFIMDDLLILCVKENQVPIIKNITINMEQVFTGSTIPVEVERWIHENNLKISETETLYVNIPKGIDDVKLLY